MWFNNTFAKLIITFRTYFKENEEIDFRFLHLIPDSKVFRPDPGENDMV